MHVYVLHGQIHHGKNGVLLSMKLDVASAEMQQPFARCGVGGEGALFDPIVKRKAVRK